MWNTKCFDIPVVTGATGIVTTRLKTFFEAIPGKNSIGSLQKAALPGTWSIITKVLSS
jgi:hypothetical protein